MPETNDRRSARYETEEELTLRAIQELAPIADRWGFRIMREVFAGVHRFGELQRNLGISRNILAERLATMVEAGLLRRVRYRTEPDWYEYRLTERTADFFPTIVAFYQWVYFHFSGSRDEDLYPPFCNCELPGSPILICSACTEPIKIDPDAVVRSYAQEEEEAGRPAASGRAGLNAGRDNGQGRSRPGG